EGVRDVQRQKRRLQRSQCENGHASTDTPRPANAPTGRNSGDAHRAARQIGRQGTLIRSGVTVTPAQILNLDDVRRLRAASSRFGEAECARKSALLARAAGSDIVESDVLVAWHDCLLYLLAYPETAALHRAARVELRRVAALAHRIAMHGRPRERRRLDGRGIAFTASTFAFGWKVACWLAMRFPRHADLDSFGEHRMPLRDVLAAALPPLEFALLADDDDDIALLDEARGRASRLAWLIAQVERLPASDAVRALAFDSLDAY